MKKLILLLPFVMCRKKETVYNDLEGTNTLQGTVVLLDTFTGSYNYSIVISVKVYLKNNGDPSGYLYAVTAYNNGKYSFNGLDTPKGYVVYASLNSSNGIKYYGEKKYEPGSFKDLQSDTLCSCLRTKIRTAC